jgi:hypothetical protein
LKLWVVGACLGGTALALVSLKASWFSTTKEADTAQGVLQSELAKYASYAVPFPEDALFSVKDVDSRAFVGADMRPLSGYPTCESEAALEHLQRAQDACSIDEFQRFPRAYREELAQKPLWNCKAIVARDILCGWSHLAPLEPYESALLLEMAQSSDRQVRLVLASLLDCWTGGSHHAPPGHELIFERSRPLFRLLLKDADPEIRKYAACTVRTLADETFVPVLLETVRDEQLPTSTRLQAALAWYFASDVSAYVPPFHFSDEGLLRCLERQAHMAGEHSEGLGPASVDGTEGRRLGNTDKAGIEDAFGEAARQVERACRAELLLAHQPGQRRPPQLALHKEYKNTIYIPVEAEVLIRPVAADFLRSKLSSSNRHEATLSSMCLSLIESKRRLRSGLEYIRAGRSEETTFEGGLVLYHYDGRVDPRGDPGGDPGDSR